MQNKHLEHPEDTILTGDLSVLDWFSADSTISVKMDGAPAIVWGTNPQNGKFFVCTKAAFNKKKIRLCYNEDDIFTHFGGQPKGNTDSHLLPRFPTSHSTSDAR